jgi:Cytochrome C oxidase, cbb3-type, subunit III
VGSLRVVSAVTAAVILLGVIAARGSAQTRGSGPTRSGGAPKTTLSGIYTAAQATKGEEVYFTFCVSCHPTPTYTGPAFKLHWQGRPLSDLYDWVSEKMPKNDPGSLSPKESVQAIAYILQLNKLPTGSTELTTDRAALTKIAIQLK